MPTNLFRRLSVMLIGGLLLVGAAIPAGASSSPAWSAPIAVSGVPALSYVSLSVVSCVSTGNCTALGGRPGAKAGDRTVFALTETHGKWGRARTLGGGSYVATSLRCTAIGTCVALGQSNTYDANGSLIPAIVTEVGGTWSPVTLFTKLLPASTLVTTSADYCFSPGNCAVGGADASGNPVLLSETAGVWSATTTITTVTGPDQTTLGLGAPTLITCASPGNCTASGSYYVTSSSGAYVGEQYVVSESAGTWGGAFEISGLGALNTLGQPAASLVTMTCTSPGNCVGGGEYNQASSGAYYREQAFLVTQTNGIWSSAYPITGLQSWNVHGIAQVNSIVCFASECQAGGTYGDAKGIGRTFVATEHNGGAWTLARIQGPNAKTNFTLGVLTCGSPGNCVATNTLLAGATKSIAFGQFATETGGKWSAAHLVAVEGLHHVFGNTEVDGATCAPSGYCAVVGSYTLVPAVCRPNSPGSQFCTLSGGQTAAYLVTRR